MNKHLKLILYTFTTQKHPNDCGLACLESIMNYAGIKNPGLEHADRSQRMSLLELQKISKNAGIACSCVKMDMNALNANQAPCILHVINPEGHPHFIVHYPVKYAAGMHLIGDPDTKVELITEAVLLNKWLSRTALYMENVKPGKKISSLLYPWNSFSGFKFIPKFLCLSVPALHVLIAGLGLSVTLVIQRAAEPGFVSGKTGFLTLLMLLLGILTLAKCLVNYFKHGLLVEAGLHTRSKLTDSMLKNTIQKFGATYPKDLIFRKLISDSQSIQQAISLLVGVVLADGLLWLMMFTALFIYQPVLLIFEAGAGLSMLLIVDLYLPLLMINPDPVPRAEGSSTETDDYVAIRSAAKLANKINFSFEAVNSLHLIIVLSFLLYKLHANAISYETFLMAMVICYGMGLFMTRICNQLFTIAQGAEQFRQAFPGRR